MRLLLREIIILILIRKQNITNQKHIQEIVFNIQRYMNKKNGSGIGVEEASKDGIGVSDEAQTTGEDDAKTTQTLTCTQTYYRFDSTPANYCKNSNFHSMIFSTSTYYWLASRCVNCDSGIAFFGLHIVGNTGLSFAELFESRGNGNAIGNNLRPTVSLGSNITLTPCEGANDAENPHTLSKVSS